MCELFSEKVCRSRIGYKIVCKDPITNRYFSSMMGFEYRKDEDIPMPKKQNILCPFWDPLTEKAPFYRKLMEGRTSVFLRYEDAERLFGYMKPFQPSYGLKLVIVRAKVYKEVLLGHYFCLSNFHSVEVAAGRRIKILEEVVSPIP